MMCTNIWHCGGDSIQACVWQQFSLELLRYQFDTKTIDQSLPNSSSMDMHKHFHVSLLAPSLTCSLRELD